MTKKDQIRSNKLHPPPASPGQRRGQLTSTQKTTLFPSEYLEGIRHFNAGRFFDAHESWETVWLRSTGKDRLFLQMLIQCAVGLHHFQRGNMRGVAGMYNKVKEKLKKLPPHHMSLDLEDFSRSIHAFFEKALLQETLTGRSARHVFPQIRLR